MKQRDWSLVDAMIRESYPVGGPAPIMASTGLSKGSVCGRAKKLGVKCLDWRSRRAATIANGTTSVDQAFFAEWSPNLAWLLGYIWADGSVHAKKSSWYITFRCVQDDEQIITDIRTVISSTSPIQRFESAKCGKGLWYDGRPQVGFMVTSKNVVQLVVDKYGIPPNKSNLDPPFPDIPDAMLPHFIRGAIDGDGSFVKDGRRVSVQMLGSHRFIEAARHRVSAAVGVDPPNRWLRRDHGPETKLSVCQWARRESVLAVIRWLYPPGEYLCLHRKRDVAVAYLERYSGPVRRPLRLPQYRKSGDYATCTIDGQKVYLGRHGTEESRVRYAELLAALEDRGLDAVADFPRSIPNPKRRRRPRHASTRLVTV